MDEIKSFGSEAEAIQWVVTRMQTERRELEVRITGLETLLRFMVASMQPDGPSYRENLEYMINGWHSAVLEKCERKEDKDVIDKMAEAMLSIAVPASASGPNFEVITGGKGGEE